MDMIDILSRLKQIQENNPNIDVKDAINSVARTNGAVEKNEGEMDESMTRQHFQYVADTLKNIEDVTKRAEYAQHHSAIFQHFNPNFDHDRFMQAAGVYTVTKGKEENTAVEEGKVKSWLMDLESDAVDMTREAFIKKHGQSQAHVWDRVQKKEKENEGKEMKKDKMNESVVIATDNPAEAAMMMQLLKLAGVQPISQDMINQPSAEVQADETYANTPKENTVTSKQQFQMAQI